MIPILYSLEVVSNYDSSYGDNLHEYNPKSVLNESLSM